MKTSNVKKNKINKIFNKVITAILLFVSLFPLQLKADVVGIVGSGIQTFNESTWLPVTSVIPLTMSGYTFVHGLCVTWNSDDLQYYAAVKTPDTCHLVTVDPLTGICTDIGPMDNDYYSLTYNSDFQQMYCINSSLRLVDLSTGATSSLGGGPFSSDIIAYNYDDGYIYSFPTYNGPLVLEKISTQFPFLSTTIPITGDAFDFFRAVVYRGGNTFIAASDINFPITVNTRAGFTIHTNGVATIVAPTNEIIVGGLGYVDPLLPVELTAFTSTTNSNNVTLNWSTFSETNNSGFDIERAIDNGQLTIDSWTTIGNVIGSGTINEPREYSFTDRNLASGKYKYRLKQIDYNGNFEYFNLSNEVNIGVPNEYTLSQNYPNPFNPTTNLEFGISDLGFVSLKIYDISGKEVMTLVNEQKTPGYYTVSFNGANLSSGIYFYTIQAGDFVSTKKMTLLK